MLLQHFSTLTIQTPGRGLIEITSEVRSNIAQSGIQQGLLTLFIRHTSASLLIQENADPDVRGDLERFLPDWFATATRCLRTGQRALTICQRMCVPRSRPRSFPSRSLADYPR